MQHTLKLFNNKIAVVFYDVTTLYFEAADEEIRPVYHHFKKRIEAHICIAFAACKIYKELERQLKERNSQWSPEKAIDILKTIYRVTFQSPYSNKIYSRQLIKTKEQQAICKLFNLEN